MSFPPNSIKGQSGSKLNAKWNLQVPYNQATDLGGIDALIETGNENVIGNPGFEANSVTGWATYADASSSTPTDGTGGSPVVTFAATSSTPLSGVYSAILTKDAANRQGEGASYDFTIARKDRNQLMDVNFDYEVASGTYASGDVGVFIYDVTNATIIQPIVIDIPGVSGGGARFQTQFQSTSSTSYRLILHVRTTSASAYVLEFDNFIVQPSKSFVGTINTDPVSWTPTGSMNTNTTYTGRQWREGKFLAAYVKVSFSGVPNTTGLSINLPSGLSIDTNAILTATNANSFTFGHGNAFDSSAGDRTDVVVEYNNTTSVSIKQLRTVSIGNVVDSNASFSQSTPFTVASGDSVEIYFKVPIQGWTAANAATQGFGVVPGFRATLPASDQTVSSTSATKVNFNTSVYDTTGSFDTSTQRYTIPETGTYLITAQIYFALLTANDATSISLYVDGALHSFNSQPNASTSYGLPFNTQIKLNKGQYIEIFTDSSADTDYRIEGAAAGRSWFSATRIDKNMFGMNQQVFASYTTNAGQSIADGAEPVVVFEDKVADTHNAYNTSTGVFTAPIDGLYTIKSCVNYASASFPTATTLVLSVFKNGTKQATLLNLKQASNTQSFSPGVITHSMYLNAGDTADVRTLQNSGGARTLNGVDVQNFITIIKEN